MKLYDPRIFFVGRFLTKNSMSLIAIELFRLSVSFLKFIFVYLFIFGCIGSSLLRVGFL